MHESEKFNPIFKEEPIKKKSGRLSKLIQAGALAGSLLGVASAHGQGVIDPDVEMANTNVQGPEQKEEEISQEKEEYWLKLPTSEAIKRFPEYANRDFTQHLLEFHVNRDPLSFLENSAYLANYIDYKTVTERAVVNILEDDILNDSLLEKDVIEIYKVLDNYTKYTESAAKRALENKPEKIIRNAETLFKHLSPTSAEYFFREAIYKVIDEHPLDVVHAFGLIKKYLPDADKILVEVAEKAIEKGNPINFLYYLLNLDGREQIFSPAKLKNLMEKIVEDDPRDVLSILLKKNYRERPEYKMISMVNSTILDPLIMIAEDDTISNEEKYLASFFVDALIYDKHLTLKELLVTIKNPAGARKLAKEITSRSNYIGKFSLEEYLEYLDHLSKPKE